MDLNVLKPQKIVKRVLTVQNISCMLVATYSDWLMALPEHVFDWPDEGFHPIAEILGRATVILELGP